MTAITNADRLAGDGVGITRIKKHYEIEIYSGKNVLTNVSVTAHDDEEAIRLAAASLKISIRKRHAINER